jgi:hypothetical protein
MGGTFCFFYKDRISGGWSCPIPDFVFLFLYQLRMAHHWNPDIPEDNERLHRKRTFVLIFYSSFLFTAITVLERRCLFLIEAGRMAMGCT